MTLLTRQGAVHDQAAKQQQNVVDYYIGLNTRAEPGFVDGPKKGHCPTLELDPASGCWKFYNPDPQACWDFYWILSLFPDPHNHQAIQMTNRMPLANGDFLVTITEVEPLQMKNSPYLKRLKLTESNFALIKMSQPEVSMLHQQISRLALYKLSTCVRFNSMWQVQEIRTISFEQLPHLAEAAICD